MVAQLRLVPGGVYVLRNEETLETAQFTVSEMRQYKGEVLVSGSTNRHEIYVPRTRGRVSVAGRESAFPIFPRAMATDVHLYMAALDSLPVNIYNQDLSARYPVVNATWERNDRLSALDKAAVLIDAWHTWQLVGELPERLRRDVRGARLPLSVRSPN